MRSAVLPYLIRSIVALYSGRVVHTSRNCDTGMSGQRWSDGNIKLVRFLDCHKGDGARAVFAGVQLLYKNNFPNESPLKFAHH